MNRSYYIIVRCLLLFVLLGFVPGAMAQIVQPSGSGSATTSTCSGSYYDMGGSGGNYSANQSSVQTICPVNSGDVVTLTFTSFNTESCCDGIYIYDGPNTSCPQLAVISGTPATPFSYTAKNCGGCLTVYFVSDGSVQSSGFAATVSCSTPASYTQIGSTAGSGPGATSGPQCIVYSCGTTYYDPGGSASNYSNNQNSLFTICATPVGGGTVPSVTFNSFNVESGYDWLAVFDGSNNQSTNLLASYTGNLAVPFTVQATTNNVDGCLTFWFSSDGLTNKAGWSATISCVTPTSNPTFSNTDCWNSSPICNDLTVPGASSGAGYFNELTSNDEGCLTGENQSNWYHFQVTAGGTFTMGITPGNSSDDYDYALWGPMTSFNCLMFQSANSPVRCSYACYGASCGGSSTNCSNNSTGISSTNNGAQTDVSEGKTGNCWTKTLNVNTGEDYILLIDNYLSSTTTFTIDIGGTAQIGCVPIVLPLGLLNFLATPRADGTVDLTWTADGEKNEKFYVLERSLNGTDFSPLGIVGANVNKTGTNSYGYTDKHPIDNATNYYRLSSVDQNGTKTAHTIALANLKHTKSNFNTFPNPALNDLNITLENSSGQTLNIEIYDLYGRIVLQQSYSIENGLMAHKLDISALQAGPYIIKASDGIDTYHQSVLLTKE